MTLRNPKQEGSNLYDCKPQVGACPMNCNQCFYNRPGAYYGDVDSPLIPSPEEVGDGIVRMNCVHDSNIEKDSVLDAAKKYKNAFFNTSIANFDFPGPVVYTANSKEEEPVDLTPILKDGKALQNLMFIRLRVSTINTLHIAHAVTAIHRMTRIPIVLTFMAYYDNRLVDLVDMDSEHPHYEWKKRHINSYWCLNRYSKMQILGSMKNIAGRQVTMCGTLDSVYCRDCRNCETYYWQAVKHLNEL